MLNDVITISQTFFRIRNSEFKHYSLRDNPRTHRLFIIVCQRGATLQNLPDSQCGDHYNRKALY